MTNERQPASSSSEGGDSIEGTSPESAVAGVNEPLRQARESGSESLPRASDPEVAVTPAESLLAYIEQLEVEYKQRLSALFGSCLRNLDLAEWDFIRGDEELRNKTAYAAHEFSVDGDILALGD